MLFHVLYKNTINQNEYISSSCFCVFQWCKNPFQFRAYEDIHLVDLKFKLNTLLQYPENRRIVKLEYLSPLIDDEGKIWFTKLKRNTDKKLRVIWSTFYCYSKMV